MVHLLSGLKLFRWGKKAVGVGCPYLKVLNWVSFSTTLSSQDVHHHCFC